MQNKSKVLWSLFFILCSASLFEFYLTPSSGVSIISITILYLPVIIAVLHSIWSLSFKRGIFFILLTFLVAFFFEYLGLKFHYIFGGEYVYNLPGYVLYIVPAIVLLYWFVFIYTGYAITNSFLYWNKIRKPTFKMDQLRKVIYLVLIDLVIVLVIDLFMDPLKLAMGDWLWTTPGRYYGVPFGNFMGWTGVIITCSSTFRLFEYYKPIPSVHPSSLMNLLPISGFTLLYLSFATIALAYSMYIVLLIGTITMIPIVVKNIIFYKKFVKSS